MIFINIVLAKLDDLDEIKDMYTRIVQNMYANDINIWNGYYPTEVFESDIKNGNLYLLKDGIKIAGAFVMYEHVDLEDDVEWANNNAKAYLLNRVGVNVDYLHQGIGQKLVKEASIIAKEKKAKYLRLLVSDVNIPAINLYYKCGFNKVNCIHEEKIRDGFSIYEYGFETLKKKKNTNLLHSFSFYNFLYNPITLPRIVQSFSIIGSM